MSSGTLVIADCPAGQLDEVTAELVSAAGALGEPVILGVLAPDPAAVPATHFAGIDRIMGVQMPVERTGHEARQRAVEALLDLSRARTVLMPLNWDTAAFASALAESNGLSFVSDVTGLSRAEDGATVVTRLAFAGKVCARLGIPSDSRAALLLRPGSWAAAELAADALPTELADVEISPQSRVRLVKVIEADAGDADLTQAEVIFGLGRGVGKAEHIEVFENIAAQLGVAIGASRPLVDVGLVPRARQIGQSGVTVKPKLYVAFGISGSLQHMAGISESKMLVAINTDEVAPIFDSAHLGAKVDAMEVARHLLDSD